MNAVYSGRLARSAGQRALEAAKHAECELFFGVKHHLSRALSRHAAEGFSDFLERAPLEVHVERFRITWPISIRSTTHLSFGAFHLEYRAKSKNAPMIAAVAVKYRNPSLSSRGIPRVIGFHGTSTRPSTSLRLTCPALRDFIR
jgi:hypothetical protein